MLIDLVYELLDAHTDTVVLASDITDPAWEAHTDYVRALHRRGREILAVSAREAAYTDSVITAPTEDVRE
jgi:fructoselysine-6-P-deglycase FrlB-like protein